MLRPWRTPAATRASASRPTPDGTHAPPCPARVPGPGPTPVPGPAAWPGPPWSGKAWHGTARHGTEKRGLWWHAVPHIDSSCQESPLFFCPASRARPGSTHHHLPKHPAIRRAPPSGPPHPPDRLTFRSALPSGTPRPSESWSAVYLPLDQIVEKCLRSRPTEPDPFPGEPQYQIAAS